MMDDETARKIKPRNSLSFSSSSPVPATSFFTFFHVHNQGISVIFRLLLVRRHHHRSLFILRQAVRPPPADHRQLASRSRQGHPLRDRLNTARLLYEILLDDRREERKRRGEEREGDVQDNL